MKPSPDCFALIKRSEGLRLEAYQDAGGVWTIGYGHAGAAKGEAITYDEAEALLAADAAHAAESVLALTSGKVTQGQMDALTDFVFNLGARALQGSTLLMKHKAGNYTGAAAEFGRWVHCKGRTLPGLIVRRAAETHLYLAGLLL